jgi:hypothetical protein
MNLSFDFLLSVTISLNQFDLYHYRSVKVAVAELVIDPGRISKWRQHQNGSIITSEKPALIVEQAQFRRLQKELKRLS